MWKYERALELLEDVGLTRKKLASLCGIELGTLNHFLNGRRNPSRPVLLLMAMALKNIKVEELEPNTDAKAG